MRIGVFGGAFNPPHMGHLICAKEVLLQLQLERVLFVPELPRNSMGKVQKNILRDRFRDLYGTAASGAART